MKATVNLVTLLYTLWALLTLMAVQGLVLPQHSDGEKAPARLLFPSSQRISLHGAWKA